MDNRRFFNLMLLSGLLLGLLVAFTGLTQAASIRAETERAVRPPAAQLSGGTLPALPAQAELAASSGPDAPGLTPRSIPLLDTAPVLTITKQANQDPVNAGSVLTYTLTVTNDGTADATGAVITDVLDANVSYAGSSDGGTLDGGSVVWDVGTISMGQTLSRVVWVTVSDVASGTLLSNTGVVTSAEGVNDSQTINTTVHTAADLVITKRGDPDVVIAGTTRALTYTLVVTNNGPSSAQNVVVSDTLPSGFSLAEAIPPPDAQNGQQLNWNLNALARGATRTITVAVSVGGSVRGVINNTAAVTSTTTDPAPENNSQTEPTTVNGEADLALTKIDSPDPVPAVFTALVYTLTVTNNGPSDATGVVVTDTLPAGMFYVGANPAVCSNVGSSVTCNLAGILKGNSSKVAITVNPTAPGIFTNRSGVYSAETDPNTANNTASEETTVQPTNLSLTKADGPDPVLVTGTLIYTLTVTNGGPNQATNVVLTDALPAGVTFQAATPGCSHSTGTVTCNLGNIPNMNQQAVTITVKPTTVGTLVNTAEVTSTEPDLNPADNTATASTNVSPVADLRLTKSDSTDPVIAGNNLVYTLNVTNDGPSRATNVTLVDSLPAGVTFSSASAGCNNSNGTVTCDLGDMNSGTNKQVTINVKVKSSTTTQLSNTASVSSDTHDPNTANNSETELTNVITRADLQVTQTDNPDPVVAGNDLTYVLTVKNNGPSDATGVILTDTLPSGVSFKSATPGAPTCTASAGKVTCNLGGLTGGSTTQATIVVKVDASVVTGTVLSNNANVTGNQTDNNTGNNSAARNTNVHAEADLTVNSVSSPDPVLPAKDLTYNLTVTNNGPSQAKTVSLQVQLPDQITFKSASAGCSHTSGTVTCSLGNLAPNGTSQSSIVVTTDSGADGVLTSTATVSSATYDPVSNNSDTETTLVGDYKFVYLPLLTKAPPPTELSVFNDNTGGNVTFSVLGTSVSCTVPNNTTRFCGTFPPGTYDVHVVSACGTATVRDKTYSSGPQTTRVYCQ